MPKRPHDITDLGRIYMEATKLFLHGKCDQALEDFKFIYERDIGVGDVVDIINDYFDMPKDKWIAKYEARFRAHPPKQSGDDVGTGSAPVPAPKRPIIPGGSFRVEKRPDEDDRAA